MNKPAAPATGATSNKAKLLPKKIISLIHLMERSLNTLEAMSLYGETALHSTISDLAHDHGLVFDRQMEPHQHRNGGRTHFMRYTLNDGSRESAEALVNRYMEVA